MVAVRVDAILVAAAHILKSEGLERTTTNRIAERAGVSIGSLYQYFPNKLRPGARIMVELVIALHAIDPDLHNALAEGSPLFGEEERGFRRLMQERLASLGEAIRPADLEMVSFIAVRALEAVVHTTALDEPERLVNPRFAEEVTELLVRFLEEA